MIAAADTTSRLARCLGRFNGAGPGPLLVGLGGIHGNEPGGVTALQRVVEELRAAAPRGRGDFVALAGNLQALARGTRFVERDLNRQWLPERIEHLRGAGAEGGGTEDQQQWELLVTLEDLLRHRRGPAILLDLHTTSGSGPPFAIIADTLRNRQLARKLPLPVVLGLEERVEGTIIDFVNNSGHQGISIEGGSHDDPAAVDHLQAVVRLTLVAAGILHHADLPDHRPHHRRLRGATRDLPRVVELRQRHGVAADDGFTMEPGFASFATVQRGQILAHDRQGPVRAAADGRILLPLYQQLGSDGFFIVRRISRIRLWLATTLRRLRADRWLHLLPGIERVPGQPRTLLVTQRRGQIDVMQILHLLGYRRERRAGGQLALTRRPYSGSKWMV